jgi:hypothetical protein
MFTWLELKVRKDYIDVLCVLLHGDFSNHAVGVLEHKDCNHCL